jgi:aryl-alcohol dehydrogenase-like predicted oxidoreductase
MELSKTDLPLGLGTAKLRSLVGGLSASGARDLLAGAFELGIRFVDTASCYGQGDAEVAIGNLPPRLAQELTVCSKIGYRLGVKTALVRMLKPVLRPVLARLSSLRRLTAAHREHTRLDVASGNVINAPAIRADVQASLRRLRRARIEILLLHDPTMGSLNDDNQRELDDLVREGLVGQWGVCTREMPVARVALSLQNLSVLQVPVDRESLVQAGNLFHDCEVKSVSVIANRVLSPLMERPPVFADAESRVGQCFELALKQPAVSLVLCGTNRLEHLATNVRAMRRVMQSADAAP